MLEPFDAGDCNDGGTENTNVQVHARKDSNILHGRQLLRTASEQKCEIVMLATSKNPRDGWVLLKVVSTVKCRHSSSLAAMVSTHNRAPGAPSNIAEAKLGPSAPSGEWGTFSSLG